MTREEAFARVSTLLRKRGEGLDSSHRYAGASIAALEALGLIAFDDEGQDEINRKAAIALNPWVPPDYGAKMLDALRQAGFKVVRA